jgi:AraC-like DNA-binding protein
MIEDYHQALEMFNRCLAANDKNIPAHYVKTLCLLQLGRYKEVINYFDTIPADVIIQGEKTGAIGLAYALSHDLENAAIYMAQLLEQAKQADGFQAHSFLFLMYSVLGEHDLAFEWVNQAIKKKSSLVMLRFTDPIVNSLKKDPRYDKWHHAIYKTEVERKITKKKKPLLDKKTARTYASKLLNYIAENKPYLEPNLSLRTLADQIGIHPNQLSWLLNESLGKNFNEFINHYRIDHFKELAQDLNNSKYTILALAYDSGFNSKTVFNTYFKKETGLTPKQFLKR